MNNTSLRFHEISSMSNLLDSDAQNFFFDIEDTIFAENVYYTALRHNQFRDILMEMCANVGNLNHITSYGKNFTRRLLDPDTSYILRQLAHRKTRIFSITSGFLSFPKIKRLQELKINFEYIIFTKKIPKGPVLVKFLNKYHISGKCAFIDNDLHKVENVYHKYSNFYNKPIDLFLFKRDYNKVITPQQFQDYWAKVISYFKRNRKI